MRKLENKKVDEIGKALVRASAVPARDIERIVAERTLFDSVRKRIAVETAAVKAPRSRTSAGVSAAAASMILIAIAFAFFVFTSKPVEVAVDLPITLPDTTPAKRFTEPDRIVNTADLPPPVTLPRSERTATRPDVKPARPRQHSAQRAAYEGDFYALSYAGDPNETERGGRIVRMDIPRTILFAMGVDIPLENETETVRADLLIGSDGVTRAIRVVK